MTKERGPMKLIVVIICDDVRREDNGKEIIIGVYTSEIIVSSLPANLNLVFWVMLEPNGMDTLAFDLRLIGAQDQSLAAGSATAALPDPYKLSSFHIRLPIQVQTAGKIRLQWRQTGSKDWETIREIGVGIGATLLTERVKKS